MVTSDVAKLGAGSDDLGEVADLGCGEQLGGDLVAGACLVGDDDAARFGEQRPELDAVRSPLVGERFAERGGVGEQLPVGCHEPYCEVELWVGVAHRLSGCQMMPVAENVTVAVMRSPMRSMRALSAIGAWANTKPAS